MVSASPHPRKPGRIGRPSPGSIGRASPAGARMRLRRAGALSFALRSLERILDLVTSHVAPDDLDAALCDAVSSALRTIFGGGCMFVCGPAPTVQGSRLDPTRRNLTLALALVLAAFPLSRASAAVLDFGAALQELDTGEVVGTVNASGGGWMVVDCHADDDDGRDACVIFDSGHPDDQRDLGTPNRDFGGPGFGRGGRRGAEGENSKALGNVLVISGGEIDDDDDDGLGDPSASSEGGKVCLSFSHAGRLTLTLIDVDTKHHPARIQLYHEGERIKTVEAEPLGNNSAQKLDFSRFGDVDRVCIHLEGTAAIGAIRLEVPQVGVQPSSWTGVKTLFR